MISGNLFTRDYLLEGITRSPAWQDLSEASVLELKHKLAERVQSLLAVNKPNEAQTEKTLIYPVLEILGWSEVEVQQTLSSKGRKQIPDAVLFKDTAARNRAVAEKDHWKRYQHGLAILEAKRWGRTLDRSDRSEAEEGVPSNQMLQYLSRVDVQTSGKVRLGILTNGVKWRLYFQGALSVSEDFFEIDLGKALELPGHELDLVERANLLLTPPHCLKLFAVMFGRQAFLPVDGPRTFHDLARDEGKNWEARVTRDLSHLVFHDLYPGVVAAIHKHDTARPASIDANYLESVRQSALILLYRLLFVVYAEDRELLPDSQEPYKSYSLTTMRGEIADRFSKGQVFSSTIATFWPKLTAVFKAISEGDDALGIPPYNGGLFAQDGAPLLGRVQLPDAVIAHLIFKLSHREETPGTFRYINYRDLGVQQLGTIYERTLEYGLRYDAKAGAIVVDADDTARHESGSYYTPDSLVSLIIEKSVGPFVEEKLAKFKAEAAKLANDKRPVESRLALLQGFDPALHILELRVCDPAMGSGHFLVNLVDWLADKALAAIAEAEQVVDWSDKPYRSPAVASIEQTRVDIIRQATLHQWPFVVEHLDDRHIVRRTVLKRCIYGVDKNPMAVELAKVALWLHTFTVGAPLSFLDHHLRCGNSLFGFWIREAMDRLTDRGGQLLINEPIQKAMAQAAAMQKLERVNDIDIAEVHQSKTLFDGIENETRPFNMFLKLLYALDWLKLDKADETATKSWLDGQFGDPFDLARGRLTLGPAIENGGTAQSRDVLDQIPGPGRANALRFAGILRRARELIANEGFHNWQVAFPGVWTKWESEQLHGGFHAVIGNPPYVRQELIRSYKTALEEHYETFAGQADLYVYFYEQGLKLLRPGGRLSYVVTNKWMRADYAERLRGLFETKAWVEFVADFGHAKRFFPDADVFPSVLVLQRPRAGTPPENTVVCAMPRDDVPDKNLDQAVANPAYNFVLPRRHFARDGWVLDRPEGINLLNKIRERGAPLRAVLGADPLYGIKTGLNEAYIVDAGTRDRLIAEDPASAGLFRPYLRGQDISRWSCPDTGLFMIVMKSSSDHPWPWAGAADEEAAEGLFEQTYPAIYRHLKSFEVIPDSRGGRPKGLRHREDQGRYWWELRPCGYYAAFDAPKTLYVDIAWTPSFLVDRRGRFTNNTCYFLPTAAPDVAASLNAPVGWWFAWRKAQHGKDEALRFFTSFMETYPVAPLEENARIEVSELVDQASSLAEQVQVADQNIAEWLKVEFEFKTLKPTLASASLLAGDQFVAAVRDALPKKRKLSAAEVAELKREFGATVDPARRLRAEVFATERRLSDLVNEAYGLTQDEVELMWRTAPPRMPFMPNHTAGGVSVEKHGSRRATKG